MADPTDDPHDAAVEQAIELAARLGVELDRAEAAAWVAEIASTAAGKVSVDVDSGVYGHRVTMADHDAAEMARFRRIAVVVGFEDRPPELTSALALSGSAAQGRIQRFPGDCDFFERIHILAPTRDEACRILATAMREKALAFRSGPGYRLQEVKLGAWTADGVSGGVPIRAGEPVSWSADDVEAGAIDYVAADGAPGRLTWADAARDPGWCKLDWLVADVDRGSVSKASNVLDVTWEAPDGSITPLDGFLDPYFQEVYLETDSIPLFSRLVKEMGADAVAEYVERLEHEVWKYAVSTPNYGKAARRLYNIFRLTGRYAEAIYVRELFDEPVTALYQVAALLETLDEASDDGFRAETMIAQVDALIIAAIDALEGRDEVEMVRRLTRFRDAIERREERASWVGDVGDARDAAFDAVNAYFERALLGVPSIRAYLEDVAARHG
jgi:hypothetical protein